MESRAGELRAGAAAVDVEADDGMVIGGGIGPGRLSGQEGRLRAPPWSCRPGNTLCLISCDTLGMLREDLDLAAREIERELKIPFDSILLTNTHTHHAPTTVTIHGYRRDETFCRRMIEAMVAAARQAQSRTASAGPCRLHFWQGEESSVGQNSRLLLADGTIFWVGKRDDAVRPTGPFDPDLPVLAFKRADGALQAVVFNHSTHNIGSLQPGRRSPGFYGLAAQQIEDARGGTVLFLPGAFGSTHNLSLSCEEMVLRIRRSVEESLALAEPRPVSRVISIKREFTYRVRRFDEASEDEAVSRYCRKRSPVRNLSSRSSMTCGRSWPPIRARPARRGCKRAVSEMSPWWVCRANCSPGSARRSSGDRRSATPMS